MDCMQLDGMSVVFGLDVSDKTTSWCEMGRASDAVVREGSVSTSAKGLERLLGRRERSRVVLEVGKHSPWMREAIEDLGHEVVVANPRKVLQVSRSSRKTDRNDAEILAQLGRVGTKLLFPVTHRSAQARQDLSVLRARDQLVQQRTALINLCRGMAKTNGTPLPAGCHSRAFAKKVSEALPAELAPSLGPLVALVGALTRIIDDYEKTLEEISDTRYPQVETLRQIHGVGLLTALAFVLVIDDPHRFGRSRTVGPYLGMIPRLNESGDRRIQSHITREGDALLRRLLVQSAHYILGPFGQECDLRRYGERIVTRGGERAKRRAVIAVARKLAVLLHHLWVTGEEYDPNHNLPTAN